MKETIETEIMKILDRWMDTFNRLDMSAWENTFHFPHYRLAAGRMRVINKPGEQDGAQLRDALESTGWHHSQWDRRRIIHATETKAHVDTQFTRYRTNGTVIGSYESLYILTKEEERWGVKMRSSFAPR